MEDVLFPPRRLSAVVPLVAVLICTLAPVVAVRSTLSK